MRTTKVVTFEAAHKLPMYESIHGHSFKCTVINEGNVGASGTLMDFEKIEYRIKARYDHKLLNDFMVTPTLENIAADIGRMLGCAHVIVERPALGESAEWTNFGIPK